MKYIISTIGKFKNNDENLITQKYLKRIKNIELNQYEIKLSNLEKKLEEEGLKLINSTPKNGKLILLDEHGENLSSSELAYIISKWRDNNISSINFGIGGAFGHGKKIKKYKEAGIRPPSPEGMSNGDWVLIDAKDILIHIFRPEVRDFYSLEKMWTKKQDEKSLDSADNKR